MGCLLYWILILFYSGPQTLFSGFWLGSAVVLAMGSLGGCLWEKAKKPLPKWVPVSLKTLLYCGLSVLGICMLAVIFGQFGRAGEKLDYIIVPGTYEQSDYVTEHLKYRLDTAVEYLRENENALVIVAGGKTTGSLVSEAKTMSDYLIVEGISSNRIIQEKQSHNIRQSIRYCERLLSQDAAVGIVTNNIHLFRTVQIAKASGFTNVYGIGAPCSTLLQLNCLMRECILVFFDKWMGNI